MKTEIEMKQKNEEILAKWRKIGLLKGLKEGSINEWRCAKSFDDLAQFLLSTEKYNALCTVAFPFVRRVLCTGKKRLHRIIRPEEVCEFFEEQNAYECWTVISTKYEKDKKFKNNAYARALRKIFSNFLEEEKEYTLLQILEFFYDTNNEKYQLVERLLKDCFDWEAELLVMACDMFVSQCVDKLSDALKVGDEFETDKGEKMKVVGIDGNGEIIAKYI